MGFLESIFYMAWRGIAIGLIISAPMGPVGMLCIQRTLDKGRRAGFYTGIGAAISDLFYSLLTGFGLSFIEEFLERNQNVIQLVGSAVLIAFGVYLFRRNPSRGLKKPAEEHFSAKKSILGGFLFTFSNPLILFLIIGLFARFNFLLPEFKLYQYFTGFIFIFVGALLWWWLITFSVDKVRSHFNIRSMWLINRIIGIIIFIFAIVGIFTATSSLVKGAEISCWNLKRGFGPFSSEIVSDSGVPILSNATTDTITFMAPCADAESVEFRFKVKNLHSSPSKKYKVRGSDGKSRNVKNPGWGLVLKSQHYNPIFIDISSGEEKFDGISTTPVLKVGVRGTAEDVRPELFSDDSNLLSKIREGLQGPDPTGTHNFFKLASFNGNLTLFGGYNSPVRLAQATIPQDFYIDSIGFYVAPGGEISPDEIRLTTGSFQPTLVETDDFENLENYFSCSSNPMEGYWQILDRSIDESLLRLGGDYRMAIVKAEDGYDLIYLEGSRINSDRWSPGMLKATLRPSGIYGLWNVTWYDAMFQPMSNELQAQTDQYGTLTIKFPYQNSQLRLHHTTLPAGNDR